MSFRHGDIVWVRMGNIWWPGEYCSKTMIPAHILRKRPNPVAFVKFFQANALEHVKDIKDILPYQCEQKGENIRKGMLLYYNKDDSVEHFPVDVALAENRTNGNPNVIFRQEYDIKNIRSLTVPFILRQEHVTKILKQASAVVGPEKTTDAPPVPFKFNCHHCTFGTNRLNLIILHNKIHSTKPSKDSTTPTKEHTKKSKASAKKSIVKKSIVQKSIVQKSEKQPEKPRRIVKLTNVEADYSKIIAANFGRPVPPPPRMLPIEEIQISPPSTPQPSTRKQQSPIAHSSKTTPLHREQIFPKIVPSNLTPPKRFPLRSAKVELSPAMLKQAILDDWKDDDDEFDDLTASSTVRVKPVSLPMSSGSSADTSTPKYRNIPKKDRREVIIANFLQPPTNIDTPTTEGRSISTNACPETEPEILQTIPTEDPAIDATPTIDDVAASGSDDASTSPEMSTIDTPTTSTAHREADKSSSSDSDVVFTPNVISTSKSSSLDNSKPYKKRNLRRSSPSNVVAAVAEEQPVPLDQKGESSTRSRNRKQPKIPDDSSPDDRVSTPKRKTRGASDTEPPHQFKEKEDEPTEQPRHDVSVAMEIPSPTIITSTKRALRSRKADVQLNSSSEESPSLSSGQLETGHLTSPQEADASKVSDVEDIPFPEIASPTFGYGTASSTTNVDELKENNEKLESSDNRIDSTTSHNKMDTQEQNVTTTSSDKSAPAIGSQGRRLRGQKVDESITFVNNPELDLPRGKTLRSRGNQDQNALSRIEPESVVSRLKITSFPEASDDVKETLFRKRQPSPQTSIKLSNNPVAMESTLNEIQAPTGKILRNKKDQETSLAQIISEPTLLPTEVILTKRNRSINNVPKDDASPKCASPSLNADEKLPEGTRRGRSRKDQLLTVDTSSNASEPLASPAESSTSSTPTHRRGRSYKLFPPTKSTEEPSQINKDPMEIHQIDVSNSTETQRSSSKPKNTDKSTRRSARHQLTSFAFEDESEPNNSLNDNSTIEQREDLPKIYPCEVVLEKLIPQKIEQPIEDQKKMRRLSLLIVTDPFTTQSCEVVLEKLKADQLPTESPGIGDASKTKADNPKVQTGTTHLVSKRKTRQTPENVEIVMAHTEDKDDKEDKLVIPQIAESDLSKNSHVEEAIPEIERLSTELELVTAESEHLKRRTRSTQAESVAVSLKQSIEIHGKNDIIDEEIQPNSLVDSKDVTKNCEHLPVPIKTRLNTELLHEISDQSKIDGNGEKLRTRKHRNEGDSTTGSESTMERPDIIQKDTDIIVPALGDKKQCKNKNDTSSKALNNQLPPQETNSSTADEKEGMRRSRHLRSDVKIASVSDDKFITHRNKDIQSLIIDNDEESIRNASNSPDREENRKKRVTKNDESNFESAGGKTENTETTSEQFIESVKSSKQSAVRSMKVLNTDIDASLEEQHAKLRTRHRKNEVNDTQRTHAQLVDVIHPPIHVITTVTMNDAKISPQQKTDEESHGDNNGKRKSSRYRTSGESSSGNDKSKDISCEEEEKKPSESEQYIESDPNAQLTIEFQVGNQTDMSFGTEISEAKSELTPSEDDCGSTKRKKGRKSATKIMAPSNHEYADNPEAEIETPTTSDASNNHVVFDNIQDSRSVQVDEEHPQPLSITEPLEIGNEEIILSQINDRATTVEIQNKSSNIVDVIEKSEHVSNICKADVEIESTRHLECANPPEEIQTESSVDVIKTSENVSNISKVIVENESTRQFEIANPPEEIREESIVTTTILSKDNSLPPPIVSETDFNSITIKSEVIYISEETAPIEIADRINEEDIKNDMDSNDSTMVQIDEADTVLDDGIHSATDFETEEPAVDRQYAFVTGEDNSFVEIPLPIAETLSISEVKAETFEKDVFRAQTPLELVSSVDETLNSNVESDIPMSSTTEEEPSHTADPEVKTVKERSTEDSSVSREEERLEESSVNCNEERPTEQRLSEKRRSNKDLPVIREKERFTAKRSRKEKTPVKRPPTVLTICDPNIEEAIPFVAQPLDVVVNNPQDIPPPHAAEEQKAIFCSPSVSEHLTSNSSADTSKDLDCFDFNEEDDNETTPKAVLQRNNKRRSLPTGIATTTTTTTKEHLSQIATTEKQTTPTKEDERSLHPKERNKRIFKSRNLNKSENDGLDSRRSIGPDSANLEMRTSCDSSITTTEAKSIGEKSDCEEKEPKQESLQVVLEKALKQDEKRLRKIKSREADQKIIVDGFELDQKDLAITDDEIKIAEALITFPLIPENPNDVQTDKKSSTKSFVSQTTDEGRGRAPVINVTTASAKKRTFDEALLSAGIPRNFKESKQKSKISARSVDKGVHKVVTSSDSNDLSPCRSSEALPTGSRLISFNSSVMTIPSAEDKVNKQKLMADSQQVPAVTISKQNASLSQSVPLSIMFAAPSEPIHSAVQSDYVQIPSKPIVQHAPQQAQKQALKQAPQQAPQHALKHAVQHAPQHAVQSAPQPTTTLKQKRKTKSIERPQLATNHEPATPSIRNIADPPIGMTNQHLLRRMSCAHDFGESSSAQIPNVPDSFITLGGAVVKRISPNPIEDAHEKIAQRPDKTSSLQILHKSTSMSVSNVLASRLIATEEPLQKDTYILPSNTSILQVPRSIGGRLSLDQTIQNMQKVHAKQPYNDAALHKSDHPLASITRTGTSSSLSTSTAADSAVTNTKKRRRKSTRPCQTQPYIPLSLPNIPAIISPFIPPNHPTNQTQTHPQPPSQTNNRKRKIPEVEEPSYGNLHAKQTFSSNNGQSSFPQINSESSHPTTLTDPCQTNASTSELPAHVDPLVESSVDQASDETMMELMAVPGDQFGGPLNSYFLCRMLTNGTYVPIDEQPLYLNSANQLVPMMDGEITTAIKDAVQSIHDMENANQQQQLIDEYALEHESIVSASQSVSSMNAQLQETFNANTTFLLNTADGQQIVLDQQGILDLASSGESPEFITADGQQIVLQNTPQEILAAIGLNEDLVNSLMAGQHCLIAADDMTHPQDIISAAMAGADGGFQHDQYMHDVLTQQVGNGMDAGLVYPIQQVVTASTTETNAILTQPPIMSTLEQPSKASDRLTPNLDLLGQSNLEQSLAVIGVTNVPTSLELPITITNPAIAPPPSSSNPLSIYACSSINNGMPIVGLTTSSQSHSLNPSADTNELSGYELFTTEPGTPHANGGGGSSSSGHHYFVGDESQEEVSAADMESNSDIVPVTPDSVTYASRTSPFGQNDFSCDSDSDSSSEIPLQPTRVQQHPHHHHHTLTANIHDDFDALRNHAHYNQLMNNNNSHQHNHNDENDDGEQQLMDEHQQHYIPIDNGDVLVDEVLQFMDDAEVFVEDLETVDDGLVVDVFQVEMDDNVAIDHGSTIHYVHR